MIFTSFFGMSGSSKGAFSVRQVRDECGSFVFNAPQKRLEK
jgi:hypothetical protein